MALACDDGPGSVAPTYFIYRDIAPGEPIDPTLPPTFFPPKDSDELFDALRAKYPHLKTHSERMRDAIIEFLIEERQTGQYQPTGTIGLDSITPTYQSNGSHSHSSSSVLSSPEMMNFSTPAYYANSPLGHMPSQHGSISTSSSQPSPPQSLDQMTGVFSLSSGSQPKQRVRRKMTEAEKVEYRKRRIVKACDKCARRKRKCHHNQPEMESVGPPPSSVLGHKVAKSLASASSAKSSSTIISPMSQQETESFLGHPFLNSTLFDFSPDLPDLEVDFDLRPFESDPLFSTIDFGDVTHDDSFQPELVDVNSSVTLPDNQPWTGMELADDSFECVEPVIPDWFDLDEMGVIPGFSAHRETEHTSGNRSIDERLRLSTIKGRTVSGTWRLVSGLPARGSTSCTRLRSNHLKHCGDAPRWEQQGNESDEQPEPNDPAHAICEPCPDMDSESSGYGSSTSSDQDALYEALPSDWRIKPRISREASQSGVTFAQVTGASGDRGLPSTSVAISGGATYPAAPIGRPQVPAESTVVQTQLSNAELTSTGALDAVDSATELYRLRRRITTRRNTNSQHNTLARQASNALLMVRPSTNDLLTVKPSTNDLLVVKPNANDLLMVRPDTNDLLMVIPDANPRLTVIPNAHAHDHPLTVLPRTEPTPIDQSSSSLGSSINAGSSPVHTRPRNPTDLSTGATDLQGRAFADLSSGSEESGDTTLQTGPTATPQEENNNNRLDHSAQQIPHGVQPQPRPQQAMVKRSTTTPQPSAPVHLERLRDTNRFKDHHGRPAPFAPVAAPPLLLAISAFVFTCVLCSCFNARGTAKQEISIPFALLALLSFAPSSFSSSSKAPETMGLGLGCELIWS